MNKLIRSIDEPGRAARHAHDQVKDKLLSLYDELFAHEGYANLKVEIKILRQGQKEVIIDAGKQFRFVVDAATPAAEGRGA